jgi:hypothetical protein
VLCSITAIILLKKNKIIIITIKRKNSAVRLGQRNFAYKLLLKYYLTFLFFNVRTAAAEPRAKTVSINVMSDV